MAQSCQYKGCNVPAEAGSEFCIFHSPSPKDLKKFKSALSDQLNEVGLAEDRNGRYLFAGYVFPTTIITSNLSTDAIQLPEMIEGDALFHHVKIEGDALFDNAKIEGDALFFNAKIEGDASFFNAKIKGNALFNNAKIEGYASFVGAKIEGDAYFHRVEIEGLASFNWCECGSLLLDPNKPDIRGWGDTRCGTFISNPEAAVSFWRFAQRIFSRTGEREKADAAFYFERLNRWRALRRNKADVDEPRIKRLWKNWITRPGYWVLFLLDLLFVRWTTAYGASVARLFFTWFLVIGGFGITFSMVPRLIERAGTQVWSLRNWIVGIHYSVTTFATLGLGRIGPGSSRLGMVLTSIEATLGAVLIALAVLVIGRRFMRQG